MIQEVGFRLDNGGMFVDPCLVGVDLRAFRGIQTFDETAIRRESLICIDAISEGCLSALGDRAHCIVQPSRRPCQVVPGA